MTCRHCIAVVTQAVKSVDPLATVQVDLQRKRMSVEGGKSANESIAALSAAGYTATHRGTQATGAAAEKRCCCSGGSSNHTSPISIDLGQRARPSCA